MRWARRSIAAASLERYDEAVDDLTRALDLDPRRSDALVFRGAAWRHLNQMGLAQDDIDRAFALDPENADALLERGILRQRRGDRKGHGRIGNMPSLWRPTMQRVIWRSKTWHCLRRDQAGVSYSSHQARSFGPGLQERRRL